MNGTHEKVYHTVRWEFEFEGEIVGDNEKYFTDELAAHQAADEIRNAAALLGLADNMTLTIELEVE